MFDKIKNIFSRREIQVNKAIADIEQTLSPLNINIDANNRRGAMVYSLSQLMAITGTTKDGKRATVNYDQSIFYLSFEDRINIFRSCIPVHAVVANRMNTISAFDFEIISEKKTEDRIYERLKNLKNIYDEYKNTTEPKYLIVKGVIYKELTETLIDMLPDFSNFNTSLLRWRKRIKDMNVDKGDWIKSWMMQPNINDTYESFIKKAIFDLMIHGNFACYKECLNNKIENIYLLPGGSVFPVKNKYAGGANSYVQVMQGFTDPKIYFDDELSYFDWLPNTARSYGFQPLEALINKIAETMFFDKLMADQADGTSVPEKMVIVTDQNPFGDLSKEFTTPINSDEQKRIENKINTPLKGKVMTFSGNNVQVVDLSRENTMGIQIQRQKDIREEVGLIFQATSQEMNLTGSDTLSGRSTAEAQREIYHSRAVLPIIKIMQIFWERNILPFRFGPGWHIEYNSGKSESEDIELLGKKMATGIYSVNEIREIELNIDPFKDEQFNQPSGAAQKPDGSQVSPFNFNNMK